MTTELDTISSGAKALEPSSIHSVTRSQRSKHCSIEGVQVLNRASPLENDHVQSTRKGVKSRVQVLISRLQFCTLCWTLFLAGWNDGSTGPLLPRIQEVYQVGFALVSLIFVFSCLGCIFGALINVWITDKFGFGKVIVFGAMCQVTGYTLQAPALPFPGFIAAYVINGIGLAVQDAQANGFVGALKEHPETKMGILHAAYGMGAFTAPLVATQFAQMHHWSFHYLVSLGIALSNAVLLMVVFQFKPQDDCFIHGGETVDQKVEGEDDHKFRQIISNRAVHYLAFFILVYVGVEVTIGGWIVTFIIDVRGGGPSSGYISSGFFGGLALGRVLLLWVNKKASKVGERRVLFIYTGLALGFELIIWLVPSLIGDAVAVSIVGVLLGPMYPIAMNQTSRILPRWILTGSIGWIAGFGQAGSAVLPFLTGAIASKHGIQSLHPLLLTMMVVMVVLWWLVPRERRVD